MTTYSHPITVRAAGPNQFLTRTASKSRCTCGIELLSWPAMTKSMITLLNGSLGGASGNTAVLARALAECLQKRGMEINTLHLADRIESTLLRTCLRESAGFVFLTGTYWDSWGSPLQVFFEQSTDLEAGEIWLGKPAAVVVSMHTVGGKEVASRLQGVLNTFGLYIPPMSAMVYSLANHLALQIPENDFTEDFWCLQDLDIIAHNLTAGVRGERDFKSWPVDKGRPNRRWLLP